MKRKLLTLLTAGAISAAAFTAFAGDRDEIQAFLNAQQDITAAISAAEAATSGAAVAAEFEEKRGAGRYEVDTIANGRQFTVKIDASTGAVIKTEDEGDISRADDDDIVDPAQLGAPLAELVAAAERNGGKVMSISGEREHGRGNMIEIELVHPNGDTQEFVMSAEGALNRLTGENRKD